MTTVGMPPRSAGRIKARSSLVRNDSTSVQRLILERMPHPSGVRRIHSYWDKDDWAGADDMELQKAIQSCVGDNPQKLRDVDHLIGHIKAKRDIFITSDKGDFINHRNCLRDKCGVIILTPLECVTYLSNGNS